MRTRIEVMDDAQSIFMQFMPVLKDHVKGTVSDTERDLWWQTFLTHTIATIAADIGYTRAVRLIRHITTEEMLAELEIAARRGGAPR